MSKFHQISDFAKAGLNSDLMPWDLPGSNLTNINNIRIQRGKLSPFGGHVNWTDLPAGVDPGFVMHVGSTTSPFWIVAGLNSVYVYDGNSFYDISSGPYGSVTDETLWQGCMLSKIPILNNPGHYPEYWAPQSTGTPLKPLPWETGVTWSDVNQSARIIRSHKQFLFAMDLISDGVEIPDGVRWSAPADIGGVPSSWNANDLNSSSGLTNIGGDGGNIIDGLTLRDAFVVYRESGVTVFDFVGGTFVWRVRNLSSTIGMIAPDSISEIKGSHFLIGDGDILRNDGNTIESMLHNRIRQRFVSNYDPDNYINSFAVKNTVAGEIWFCVPEVGHVYPNIAYIYNWQDDTWSIRDIPESVSGAYGPRSSPPLTWNNMQGSWDAALGTWSQKQATPLADTIVLANKAEGSNSARLIFPDRSTNPIEEPYNCIIERLGYALEGLNKVTTITRVYPHMRGPGIANIQIGSQDYPGSPVRWKPPVSFDATNDRKVDIRTTGELHCFRIYSNDFNSSWEISGMDIDYVDVGYR